MDKQIKATDSLGRPICGAKLRSGKLCQQKNGLQPNGRCSKHSGHAGRPAMKEGTSVSHVTARKRLMQHALVGTFEQALNDPTILEHTANVATLEVLIQKALESMALPDVSQWESVLDAAKTLQTEAEGADGWVQLDLESLKLLVSLAQTGFDVQSNYEHSVNELVRLMKEQKDHRKAELERRTSESNVLTQQRALELVRALLLAINSQIPDANTRRAIGIDFARIIGKDSYSELDRQLGSGS